MTLCSNRPEGFSRHSDISRPLPTSCFYDSLLEILFPFLYLLYALPLILVASFRLKTAFRSRCTRNWKRTCLLVFYFFLLFATGLMLTVEIVRDALAHLGVGLLPVIYTSLLLAPVVRKLQGRWWIGNCLLWALMAIIVGTKVAGEVKENKLFPRTDSKYPVSHQITDVWLQVLFFALLVIVEAVLGWGVEMAVAHGEEAGIGVSK